MHTESCGSQIFKDLKFNVHSALQKQTSYIKLNTMAFIRSFTKCVLMVGTKYSEIHSFIYSSIHQICVGWEPLARHEQFVISSSSPVVAGQHEGSTSMDFVLDLLLTSWVISWQTLT